MTRLNRTLSLIAIGLFLFGLVVLAVPRFATIVPASEPLVVFVGVLALLFGVLAVRQRTNVDIDQTVTPDPERPADLPTPGDDVDELIADAGLTVPHRSNRDPRQTLRTRLRRAGEQALIQRRGCSIDEARAMLRNGEWSDDPRAVAFFTGTLPESTPLGMRLRTRLAVRDPFARRARHAADAIAALTEGAQ
jgi:hypothetical protein